jgi:ATP-dependent RNA helicase DeaD
MLQRSMLPPQAAPQALVLTPTRELAIQVAEAFQSYAAHLPGFHVLPIYGGRAWWCSCAPAARGVHVSSARRAGSWTTSSARASRSTQPAHAGARRGRRDAAHGLHRRRRMDPRTHAAGRQTALFSATMPEPIRRVAASTCASPRGQDQGQHAPSTNIRQRYWQVSGLHKLDALTRILEVESSTRMLIFVRTKTATVELAEKLEARGFAPRRAQRRHAAGAARAHRRAAQERCARHRGRHRRRRARPRRRRASAT